MSRGQLKRAAIARVLLQESEMLIMDEPTNHLDIDMVEWIEKYLSTQKMTLLMVTHDRYFLDNVCNRILEIESRALYSYQGNYDYYLTKHDERLANRSAELVKVRNLLRKEQEWMRRQPQARGSKAKYRIDAFYDLKERSRQSQENDSVNPLIESSYIGSKIFEAYNVSKSYGDKRILNDWSYTFARYDKIGIVGGNGVGKTTFLRMLLGEEEPDSGHFDIGTTVKWGYYNQGEICTLDKRKKVIDAAREIAEEIRVNDKKRLSAAQFLNHFLFSVPDQQKYIYNLSGGELRRLNLAVTLMRNPNFLIFDEPTNDLDILTLSILEEYIANFKGCVIVVSHDRFFLDRIAEHIFVFRGDGVVEDFPGNYSQWRHVEQLRIQQQRDVALAKTTATASQSERQRKRTPKGLSYKENKEKEELEALLPRLETRRNLLEQQMSSGTLSTDELLHAGEEIQRIISDIDRAETRLLELMEKEESQ